MTELALTPSLLILISHFYQSTFIFRNVFMVYMVDVDIFLFLFITGRQPPTTPKDRYHSSYTFKKWGVFSLGFWWSHGSDQ